MTAYDYAAIEVGGVFVDAWTSYSFLSDLFTPADAFHMSIGIGTSSTRELRTTLDTLNKLVVPGAKVKLWIGSNDKRALQGVGIVDAREVDNGSEGTTYNVSGRDQAAYLIGSAADPKLYEKNDTLLSVARRAVAPWGIEVTADHVGSRDLRQARVAKDRLRRLQDKARSYGIPPKLMSEKLAVSIDKGTISMEDFAQAAAYDMAGFNVYANGPPKALHGLSTLSIYQLRVKDVRPQSGETVWEYLDRHARRNGLLMSMDAQGRLVFCGLQYDQHPSYRLTRRIHGNRRENNVLSGGRRVDGSDVYKTVRVYGRAKGKDKARSPYKGEAIDKSEFALSYERTLLVTDNSIKTKQDAQKRAEFELAKSKQGVDALEYTVSGHSAGGLIFATDTVAHVEDEVSGINGAYYVTARTFTRSASAGPLTSLKLVPLHSIVLPEPS